MATFRTPAAKRRLGRGRARTLGTRTVLAIALAAALAADLHAQTVSNSSLYYRMGGSGPAARANNRGQVAMKLGLGANLRLNYSCGKFDIGLSWSNIMNGVSNLGDQITAGIQAGIAALPMYILQRAQPGLYQIFQNYSQKADLMVNNALRSCEEMEAVIKRGGDPYQDWVTMAKGETWRAKANSQGDVVQAKLDITKNEEAQKNGVSWVFGSRAGGVGTEPLRPVRDLSVAGYNVTLNKPTNTAPGTDYSGTSFKSTRLVQAFKTPEELATFTAQVLGDQQVYLCNGIDNCPAATSAATATGLGPRFEAEIEYVGPRLASIVASNANNFVGLNDIGAPGMSVSPQLVDAMRRLPPDIRGVVIDRLTQELAMHRTIDKALVARNVLLTGMSLPEATAAGDVSKDVQTKLERMTRYIDDMLYEFRVRKEMTGETAMAILSDSVVRGTQAMRVSDGNRTDQTPVESGRVKAPQ